MTGAVACIDLAGTTVADGDIVETAFAEAIATLGIVSGTAAFERAVARFRDTRGASDAAVFRSLFDEPRAQAAHMAFEQSYDQLVDRRGLFAVPGAADTLKRLRSSGVRVCLLTGSGRRTQARVLDALDWWDRADLTLSPEDAARDRPCPDLVLTAALRLGVDDVRHIIVCGATAPAIESGRRAGAAVLAGVLTGPHSRDDLLAAGATHILPTVADLPALVHADAAPARDHG